MEDDEIEIVEEEKLMKYPKVELHSLVQKTMYIPEGGAKFYLQEKLDGSQFRAQINEDGSYIFGAKNALFDEWHPVDPNFVTAVNNMTPILDKFKDTDVYHPGKVYTFFMEYLEFPRHNTVSYARVPLNNLYLFDLARNGEFIADPEFVRNYANLMGLEPVKVYRALDNPPTEADIQEILKTEHPILGGQKTEGIVVKCYAGQMQQRGHFYPVIFKYVRKEFAELNAINWAERSTVDRGNILDRGFAPFKEGLENIYNKAIQHVKDNGNLTYSAKDIGLYLMDELKKDFQEEYLPVCMKEIEKFVKDDLFRMFKRGLPDYYKEEYLPKHNPEGSRSA